MGKSPHQRKAQQAGSPGLTSLLYWALYWLGQMPRERQNKKGESSALFSQVELPFVCVFGHCCTNDDTPHREEAAKMECENRMFK